MTYRTLEECLLDLEAKGDLIRIHEEVDPNLEMAEIARRAYAQQAPAILFEKVKGSPFRAACNLFGNEKRTDFIFRKTLPLTRAAVAIKADPAKFFRHGLWQLAWGEMLRLPIAALTSLPMQVPSSKWQRCQISDLPAPKCWPDDGGRFVTLPQVITQDPEKPGPMGLNIGMYRVQLDGNQYIPNKEVGLHYQTHRGIGVHHQKAIGKGQPLRVAICVGGPPALTVAAVMPLPEGLSEAIFAGLLSGRRYRYSNLHGTIVAADADFVIIGTIAGTKPEGPFGDHLGYYSLTHDFPYLSVEAVYHKPNAIWPFTVVGRPPQEDATFGELIHSITKPMVPVSLPGVRALHAVDAAGVHPLLLAMGSERYTPYETLKRPQELLTQANAILGFNQCSLAKYLFIAEDQAGLDIDDVPQFIQHILARIDPRRDLHFQTETTMDTLDYSGEAIHRGSKLVIAAVGRPIRTLAERSPGPKDLPPEFSEPMLVMPGVLAIRGPKFSEYPTADLATLCQYLATKSLPGIALVTVVDDSAFCAAAVDNWLWVTFTRSNPSHDVHGPSERVKFKHWSCELPLVIDARLKPHHAPPLIEDANVTAHVNALLGRAKISLTAQ